MHDWGQDIDNDRAPVTCGPVQSVNVDYLDIKDYEPYNPLQEATQARARSHRNKGWLHRVYQCPNQNIAMHINYKLDSGKLDVDLFHVDSATNLFLDSKLPENLPPKSPLIQETFQALQTYLCYSFEPKQFLDTLQAPPFSFPDRRGSQKSQTMVATMPAAAQPAQPVKTKNAAAKTATAAAAPTTAAVNHTSASKVPAASVNTSGVSSESAKAVRGAGVLFYPVLSPVASVRRFESADKQIELKITFQTGDKTAFLQKLRRMFASPISTRETECLSGSTLVEVAQGGSYRAFLLHPSAIVSWEEPFYPAALSNDTREEQKRQMLCSLNPIRFWN